MQYLWRALVWIGICLAVVLGVLRLSAEAAIPIVVIGSVVMLAGLIWLAGRYDPTSGESD